MLDKLMSMHNDYIKENDTWLARYAWDRDYATEFRLGAGYKKNKFY